MSDATDPVRLLHDLLDRHERNPGTRRRIMSRPAQGFPDTASRDRQSGILTAARDAGGIALEWDRDAPHLIARIILVDPAALYRHLARVPATEQRSAALARLAAYEPITDVGRDLRCAVEMSWREGGTYLGLTPAAPDQTIEFLRAADAAFTVLAGGALPLRTRSARLLGDSKAIERWLSKLLAFLKLSGRLDPGLGRDDALELLGLAKYPQPFLVAGPIEIDGVSAGGLAYLGLPPDSAEHIRLTGAIRSILTVENLESFHRQARECRSPDEIVLYCGGFPSQSVVRALGRIADLAAARRVHHWGDIDVGGIRIGRYLETSLAVPVVPHLMSPELARAFGRKQDHSPALNAFPGESAFSELARFLASDDAHWLEQEVLDPQPVS